MLADAADLAVYGPARTTSTATFNAPPLAREDLYTLGQGPSGSATVADGVLANDADADLDPLTVALASGPTSGSVLLNGDGSFTYAKGAGFMAFDRFDYQANDGQANSNVDTVTVMSYEASIVRKLYRQVLARDPEDAGWDYWTRRILGGDGYGRIAEGIFESNERLDPIIGQYYRDYLLREAEPAGLAYWRDEVWKRDGTPDNVVSGIIASPEFYASAGATNRGWVTELYRRLLGREPDTGGLDFWVDALDQKRLTREQVVLGFVRSDENFRNLINGWFDQYLRRPPQASELDDCLDQMKSGASHRQIQMKLIDSVEYQNTPAPPDPGSAQRVNDNPGVSPGTLTLAGVSASAFNAISATVGFFVSGRTFSLDPNDLQVFHNGNLVPASDVNLSAAAVSLASVLTEGRNDLQLLARDAQGLSLKTTATVWAGNHTLNVTIVDQNGNPVTDAVTVTAALGDDQNVMSEAMTGTGQVSFQSLPDRTILLKAAATGNRVGLFGTTGGAGNIQIVLLGFDPASPIDNNDFSQGTDGWDIGTAPVQIVPHDEGSTQAANAPAIKQAADTDLVLNTSGEGEQSISRTFVVKAGIQSVKVRYRFITSEVPGGYFGTQYNDYFRVSIRSQQGGGFNGESNSMNGLGLGAFDASGATAWREVTLPVSVEGDTIQVDIAVANVADGLYDSQVIVDNIDEQDLAITSLALNDVDNSSLSYLSAANHGYFGGNTRIHGTITIEGAEDDQLQSVELEVVQGGQVVARANLAAAAQTLLNTRFGADKRIEIASSQRLFDLPANQAALVDGSQDGTVSLRVRATSADGDEVTRDYGAVQILVRYTNANRYGGRDVGQCIGTKHPCGGDDWVKPSVNTIIGHFSGRITVNDFSNMNGGLFPVHALHQDGNDVDGYFAGYNARDAATAATMIGLLNDTTYGSRIRTVFVAFERIDTDEFWTNIKDVKLNDKRKAADVIRPDAGHTTHFHWIID